MDIVSYALYDYWEEAGDFRTKHLPLLRSGPVPILALITFYVLFVKWIGPAIMKNRKPLNLKNVIIVYNLYNIVISLWFFAETIVLLRFGRELYVFDFPPKDDFSPRSIYICNILYLYFLSKLIDLLDTVFFVLRKKQSQVSFLHVYHHSIVPILVWMALKIMPTASPAGLFPLLNSAIHAVMYTYYLLAALGPQYHKYLFWKKYITIMQLVQFVLYIIHGTLFIFLQRGYPNFIVYLGYVQNPLFFFMFYQFFKATYSDKKEVSQFKSPVNGHKRQD